jgi:protein-S-isoprenylcysteine O-methyltransferase Ste14
MPLMQIQCPNDPHVSETVPSQSKHIKRLFGEAIAASTFNLLISSRLRGYLAFMELLAKTLIGICFQLGFFAALTLLPIVTTDWPAAVLWLQIYAGLVFVSAGYLLVTRPAALEARMRAGKNAQAPADRLALGLMSLALLAPFALAARDVFVWQLLPAPSPLFQAVGMAVFIIGFFIVLTSMLHNEYAAPTVHIQEAAGHRLADSGIYGYLRHPMYLGFLLFTSGTALWLGSVAATLFAVVTLIATTVYRIGVEEAVLREELPGYTDYVEKVKTRYLPFIY